MENVLPVTDWIAPDLLRMLKNELFVGKGMNSDFADEYDREFPVGAVVRVKQPWRPRGGEGIAFQPEPVELRTTPITVDKVPHVHFEKGTIEEALRWSRGREKIQAEVLKPAAQRMRQQTEIYATRYAAVNAPNILGTLGTDPTTLGFAGQARARLIEMGGWMTTKRRTAAISTGIMQAITQAATVTVPLFNPSNKIAKAFVDGYLGENGGWEFQESVSLAQMTAGVRAGAITVNGAVASGASSITFNCTLGDTFKAGEKFSIGSDAAGPWAVNPGTFQRANGKAFQCSIAGEWDTVYTATGATITLPLVDSFEGPASGYQNITTLPANGDTVTMWPGTAAPDGKTGTLSLLFTRDAYALCGVKLANPEQGGTVRWVSEARDPETGLGVSAMEVFDPIERRWVIRFDGLLGFGSFYNRNCAIVFAGA